MFKSFYTFARGPKRWLTPQDDVDISHIFSALGHIVFCQHGTFRNKLQRFQYAYVNDFYDDPGIQLGW